MRRRARHCARGLHPLQLIERVAGRTRLMGKLPHRRYDMSIRASRGQTRRDFASSLGLLAVLFNLLASIVFAANPASADGLIATQDDRIVICTSAGQLVFDSSGHPIESNGGAPHAECFLCLPLMNAAGAPPAADTAVVERTYDLGASAAPVQAARQAGLHLNAASRPRAPPAASFTLS